MDPTDPRPTDDTPAASAADDETATPAASSADAVADDETPTSDTVDAVEGDGVAAESVTDGSLDEVAPAATGFAGRHPVLVYTALRLAILAAVGGVLYLLGARGLILLVFAFLVSGLISMVALARPREGAAYGITSTVRKVNERIDAASRAEDDDDIDELMDDVSPDRERPDPPTS